MEAAKKAFSFWTVSTVCGLTQYFIFILNFLLIIKTFKLAGVKSYRNSRSLFQGSGA